MPEDHAARQATPRAPCAMCGKSWSWTFTVAPIDRTVTALVHRRAQRIRDAAAPNRRAQDAAEREADRVTAVLDSQRLWLCGKCTALHAVLGDAREITL